MITQEYVSRDYLLEQYKIAYSDFILAKDEDAQWECRKSMARLETIAFDCGYGEEFVEQMRDIIKED